MKHTLTFIVELIVMFIGITIFVFLLSSMIQKLIEEASSFGYLGIWPTDNCEGSLSLSSSGTENCMIKAQILTSNCFGKKYQIREDNCFGTVRCEDTVGYENFQATCSWFDLTGKHKYALCIGNSEKDSAYTICK